MKNYEQIVDITFLKMRSRKSKFLLMSNFKCFLTTSSFEVLRTFTLIWFLGLFLAIFFSLENVVYSNQSSITDFTVSLKSRGRGGGEWEGTKINHILKGLQGTVYCLFSYWRRGSDCYFQKLRSDIRIDHTIFIT